VVGADTYTSSSAPTTDYGTSSSLGIYATPNSTAVPRFTIPAAPTGKNPTAATLRVQTTTLLRRISRNRPAWLLLVAEPVTTAGRDQRASGRPCASTRKCQTARLV
jgi:hypothetical protein